jgi:type-2 restriction enzyme mboI
MKEQFKTFLSRLSETNATLDYFVDFEKVIGNVRKIALKLNQLNYLIGKDNFTILFQMFITLPLWLSLLKKEKKEKTIKF